MYISRRAEALPLIVGVLLVICIVYALRTGAFPIDWVQRSAKPIRFWLELALATVVAAGCLVWGVSVLVGDFN